MRLLTTQELFSYAVFSSDGTRLGTVQDLLFEENFWLVRYLTVETNGRWKRSRHPRLVLSPGKIQRIDRENRTIELNLPLESIETSPPLDVSRPLSREYEELLSHHYQWPRYWVPSDPSTKQTHLSGYLYAMENVEIPRVVHSRLREREKKETIPLRSCRDLEGFAVLSSDLLFGFRISNFLVDTSMWNVPYIVLRSRSWIRHTPRLLPNFAVHSVDVVGRNLVVFTSRDAILDAPLVDHRDAELRQPELVKHYLIHFRERPEWLQTG